MAMDRRRGAPERGVDLPKDYEKMVVEALHEAFSAELKAFGKHVKKPYFRASGAVFTNEILVSLALHSEGEIRATTVNVSVDFDARASQPTAEDLLSAALDVGAGVFGALFNVGDGKGGDEAALEKLAEGSLASLEEAPLEWTAVDHEKRKFFVRVDKTNPDLEKMTEAWLDQNDPDRKRRASEDQEKAESKFVVGKGGKRNPGTVH